MFEGGSDKEGGDNYVMRIFSVCVPDVTYCYWNNESKGEVGWSLVGGIRSA